jgi:hypothetical protein
MGVAGRGTSRLARTLDLAPEKDRGFPIDLKERTAGSAMPATISRDYNIPDGWQAVDIGRDNHAFKRDRARQNHFMERTVWHF